MKFKVLEAYERSIWDNYEPHELTDDDYRYLGFDIRDYIREKYSVEDLARLWVDNFYNTLTNKEINDFAENGVVSKSDFINEIINDNADWALDDMVDHDFFDYELEDAHKWFEKENYEEINDYLNSEDYSDSDSLYYK